MPTDCKRIQKRTLLPWLYRSQVRRGRSSRNWYLRKTSAYMASRVVTVRAWKPGERVIVKSLPRQHPITSKVIYCHHLAKETIRRWVELHSAVGRGCDTSQPARAEV